MREIELSELKEILDRAKSSPLSEEDFEKLDTAVDTLAFLTSELEKKGVSIKRLRNLLFGPSTEKTDQIFKEILKSTGDEADSAAASAADKAGGEKDGEKKKRKGHGRNGADTYRGADKVTVPHESLQKGDRCPECTKGKVYPQQEPSVLVRVTGMAPLSATVYELERLRCNLCGQIFTAKAPAGVGKQKYDESASAMIALLKYGAGLPFNRLERLQRGFGIPLPASTQWEIVAHACEKLSFPYEELIRQAAQGEVMYNDDTTMKVLELTRQSQEEALEDGDQDKRTGVYTSGIVSVGGGKRIALFFTGRKHAGENLEKVLSRRAHQLGPPIQMCDLLPHNTTGDFETIVAGCILHSRRKFVEVADNFPVEVRHVLEELKKVYKNDNVTKQKKLTPEERLIFHKVKSGPVMKKLKKWLADQFKEKNVEPNSTLGEAIEFMQRHWDRLTLFLRTPGAPLDNNTVERALKKAILHRKNAMFYKTENGAHVGDIFMSFIYTSELNGADPFDYMVALQRHAEEVAVCPGDWMPWNYQNALARIVQGPNLPT